MLIDHSINVLLIVIRVHAFDFTRMNDGSHHSCRVGYSQFATGHTEGRSSDKHVIGTIP